MLNVLGLNPVLSYHSTFCQYISHRTVPIQTPTPSRIVPLARREGLNKVKKECYLFDVLKKPMRQLKNGIDFLIASIA